MKAVIQRVLSASVVVDGREISKIGRGLVCLIGISAHDTLEDQQYIIKKILTLKLFPKTSVDSDTARQWSSSVTDIGGEILCVSQFTLCANTKKGSKPDFHSAMATESSKIMYAGFLEELRAKYKGGIVSDGEFGAMMNVTLTNEGPVTILLDSKARNGSSAGSAATTGTVTPVNDAAE